MKNKRLFFHRGQLSRFLSYSLLSVALFMPTATTWAETHTTTLTQTTGKLRGRIVDAKTGEAIIGASIQVKGKKQVGTASDVQGGYTLSASPGDLLVITCIGYQTLEVRATAGEQIIQLKEDAKMLVELVVVGYTTQRKESLTGAMISLKDSKLKDLTTPSVGNLLNGKAPGVYVSPGSGKTGSD